MSITLNMSVKRGSSFVDGLTVAAQIDDISPIVIAGSGGAIPYNSSTLISLYPVAIKTGDHLYSLDRTKRLYTVSGRPETFDDHTECMLVEFIESGA